MNPKLELFLSFLKKLKPKLEFLASSVGKEGIKFFKKLTDVLGFFFQCLKHILLPRLYVKSIIEQLFQIGYMSLPVVALTAIFTGGVLALQSYSGFSRFNAESSIPIVVVLSITRELAPVLCGLMVTSRVGASIAAEIGTMRVTDQIDALVTLSTNPFKFLIVPRIIAGAISLPLLVLVADVIGIMGGYMVSVYRLHFSSGIYLKNTFQYLNSSDVMSGVIKAFVFGIIITALGAYHGYNSKGGAKGVGAATTNAVVSSSIAILLINYIITALLF